MTKPTYRCSSLPRILGCNGSLTIVPLVAERDGDEGHEGVMIHWMIADRLIRELGAQPPEGGLPPPNVPAGYKLPNASLWIVDYCVRHVRETVPNDWSLLVECEVEHEFDTFILKGHKDYWAMSPDGKKAKGGDWKTGYKPIEPAGFNEQFFGYIVLGGIEWPELESIQFDGIQPRADEESGFERVSSITLEGAALARASFVLHQRIIAAQANPLELETGLVQCAFCPAATQCPAIIAQRESMKLTLTPEAIAKIKSEPDDATLAEWAIAAKALAKPIEDAKEALYERLDARGSIQSADGVTISQKITGGSYKALDPVPLLTGLLEIGTPEQIAPALGFPKGRICDTIAECMNIKKSGKDPITAESVFEARFAPHMEQGTRRTLFYS